jgi:hypothetical protein
LTAIQNGTARAISDGSYDPLTLQGTSFLTIVAAKNDIDPLDGDNNTSKDFPYKQRRSLK